MEARLKLPDAVFQAAKLNDAYGDEDATTIIPVAAKLFRDEGGIAAISSFGADSAVLLHMISRVDAGLPVIFLDTGQHFGENLDYRDQLADDLGLRNIINLKPLPASLAESDPDAVLYRSDPDICCAIRKVEPMARAVEPYAAWF